MAFSLFIVACLKEQGNAIQQGNQEVNRVTSSILAEEDEFEIPACFPGLSDGKDCDGDYKYITDYIDIPANGKIPACKNVKVTYAVRKCYDANGNPTLNFGALTLYHNKTVCPELEAYINSLPLSSQSSEYDKVEYIASAIIEKREVLKLPKLTTQVESNYYVMNCYQRCKTQTKSSKLDNL